LPPEETIDRLADRNNPNPIRLKFTSFEALDQVQFGGVKSVHSKLITQFPSQKGGRREGMMIDWERVNGEEPAQGKLNPSRPASTSPDSQQAGKGERSLQGGPNPSRLAVAIPGSRQAGPESIVRITQDTGTVKKKDLLAVEDDKKITKKIDTW